MNYLPVVIAAVVNMIVGYMWYGPVFGKQWMKLSGVTEKSMADGKPNMGKIYGLTYVAAVVMAYVLSMFTGFAGATTATQGAMVGFWVWLGFVAPANASKYLFANKAQPWNLYYLEQGYWLLLLLVNGGLLAVWR